MMQGTVTAEGDEALLLIEVLSPSYDAAELRTAQVEAIVDTGFTGYLQLPPAIAFGLLSLPLIGRAQSVLADDSIVIEDVCRARAIWHGRDQAIRVLVSEGTPLVGMALLRGSEVRMRVVGGGAVEIEELA